MKRATYIRLKTKLAQALILTVVSTILFVYFNTGLFTIRTYKILGAPLGYAEDLERDARLVAENTLFFILPGNRTISYHDDDLRTLIMETLPNTSNITIYPSGLHTLTIKLKQHMPLFSVSDTHAISEDGTVYKEIIPVSQFPRLEVATSSSVHPKVLRSVADLVEKIDSILFPVHFIGVDEHNDIRLYNEDKRSFVVVGSQANMDMVWSNLLSAIDTDPLKGKLEKEMRDLEYIDTRFGNKVFYKFTSAQSPVIIPEQNDTTEATTTPQ